jgi:hypothetical protein
MYPNTRVHLVSYDLSIHDLKKNTLNILKAIDSYKYEPWLLVIGERDCREHILAESLDKNSLLDEILAQYVGKVSTFLSVLNSSYTVYASSSPPTGIFPKKVDGYYVPREIRQVITAKYNAQLKIACKSLGIPYLEVWKLGAAPKDMLPASSFNKDLCHIRPEICRAQLDKALKTL